MKRTIVRTCALIAVWGISGCDSLQSNTDVLARAAGHELTVEQASGWLADQDQLPIVPEVVKALADLWIDYVLLAKAVVEDSTLATLDFEPLIKQQVEQEMVFQLRNMVVQPDTVFTEQELEALYLEEKPGARVRARHILLAMPEGASEEQRDSVFAFARDLGSRARAGESFEELAREHSIDPASGSTGGDLGFFTRNDMVPAFSEVAFATGIGEVSEAVETPYGVHIINVLEEQIPPFEDARLQFLTLIRGRLLHEAESIYIADIEGPAEVSVSDGAYDIVRQLAERPLQRLSRRAQGRAMTRYRGGRLDTGEFQEWVQAQTPAIRAQLISSDEEPLEQLLTRLTRGELLVAAAEEAGVRLESAEMDSLRLEARNRFSAAVGALGLRGIEPQGDETVDEAIARRVNDSLQEILQGNRDVLQLGAIAYSLRQSFRGDVLSQNVQRVLDRVEETRGLTVPSSPPGAVPPGG